MPKNFSSTKLIVNCCVDAEVVPSADDDGAHRGRASGPRLLLLDGPLRPARLAAAAAPSAFRQQGSLYTQGTISKHNLYNYKY